MSTLNHGHAVLSRDVMNVWALPHRVEINSDFCSRSIFLSRSVKHRLGPVSVREKV